jgi:hypothetical protein
MGTRHAQTVINKEGVVKVRQYCQWDGYPSGQGLDVLKFLRSNSLEKYSAEIDKLKEITEEDLDLIVEKRDWETTHPHLSRDCGAKIHDLILNGEVDSVSVISEAEANRWCEGFYTVNLKEGIFEVEYDSKKATFSLNNLPKNNEFLKLFK